MCWVCEWVGRVLRPIATSWTSDSKRELGGEDERMVRMGMTPSVIAGLVVERRDVGCKRDKEGHQPGRTGPPRQIDAVPGGRNASQPFTDTYISPVLGRSSLEPHLANQLYPAQGAYHLGREMPTDHPNTPYCAYPPLSILLSRTSPV